jgi:hypothetical protein
MVRRHPNIQISLVRRRSSPISGSLVPSDVVFGSAFWSPANAGAHQIKNDFPKTRRRTLAPYKVPASICFVRSLAVAAFGNLVRC